MAKQDSPKDGTGDEPTIHRFYVRNPAEVWKRLGIEKPKDTEHIEHVYLDTGYPTLSFTGFVRGRRVVDKNAKLFNGGDDYEVQFRPSADKPPNSAEEKVAYEELPDAVPSLTGMADIVPWFGARFTRRHHKAQGLAIEVDSKVTYYSLLSGSPFCIGTESAARVTVTSKGKPRHEKALAELLEELPHIESTTKKWMGFFFFQRCYEIPRHDELHGFEYELKLDVEHLDIDISRLSFPVIEVHQSDSLRHYYADTRASLRGESAHYVDKGPVQSIGGVLKRREVKKKGMSSFEMPDPDMVMRRYKREINVVNPDSGRVYTISLHHCDAGKTFQQLEIEYDGRLIPGAVTEMARFRLDHDTRHILNMATRADAAGRPAVGDALRHRYLALTPDAIDHNTVMAAMTGIEPSTEPHDNHEAERRVVEDMVLLRESILRQGAARPSRTTKRKWLRQVYAQR